MLLFFAPTLCLEEERVMTVYELSVIVIIFVLATRGPARAIIGKLDALNESKRTSTRRIKISDKADDNSLYTLTRTRSISQ